MKKFFISMIIITLLLSSMVTGCSNTPSKENDKNMQPLVTDNLQTTNENKMNPDVHNIMNIIKSVSSYKRSIGSQGEKEVCEFLIETLKGYGYSPQIQLFPYNKKELILPNSSDSEFWDVDVTEKEKDGDSQNLIFTKKSYENNSKSVIIISAHYDDTGYGAVIDNATGVSILAEVARIIADIPMSIEIQFVLFGGEEAGLKGSRFYVSKLSKEDRSNVIANINLDYLGVKGENDLIMATIDGKENKATTLFENFKAVKVIKAPTSDYISFAKAGIPAVSLGQLSTPINMEYNSLLSEEERQKEVKLLEINQLDETRLKDATNMLIKVLSKYIH